MGNQLLNRLDLQEHNVYSFDVFDTVLTRTVSPPSAVFLLVGRRAANLLNNCSPLQFAHSREQAESRAYDWHGAGTSLDDIYKQLREILDLSVEQVHQLSQLELAVESDVLYAVPEVHAAIKDLREMGMSIQFVSDMYVPDDQIRDWLIEHDIWQPEDQLVVSCEQNALKYNGRLFEPIIDRCGSSETITHIGNNQKSDINGARRANIQPCHVTDANPNRYEQILEKHTRDTGGMSALLAGASRFARLHTEVESSHEEALRDVAAGVLAPVVTSFVLWILQQAEERSLDRVYFGSRDGYLLVSVARSLTQALNYSIDIKYLYLSRAAVTAACLNPTVISETWDGYEQASGKDLLARLNLDMEDIAPYLPSEETRTEVMREPITERGKEMLETALFRLHEKSPHQSDKLLENRKLFRSYLEQEGLAENKEFAFVDIGWKGTIHGLLNDLLIEEEMISDPIPGLYFGLNADQQAYAEHRTAYFFDEYREMGLGDSWPPGTRELMMEMFCTADHGTVTGYRENESEVEPVLEATWGDRMDNWGFPIIQRTVDSYVEGFTHSKDYITDSDVRAPLGELLRVFWRSPEPREAEAWGNFPREVGQSNEQTVQTLAEPYDASVLLSFARHGHFAHKVLNAYPSWPEASLARSPLWLRRSIRYLLRTRKTAKRAVRALKSRIG